jgi:hypothetical protein
MEFYAAEGDAGIAGTFPHSPLERVAYCEAYGKRCPRETVPETPLVVRRMVVVQNKRNRHETSHISGLALA